MSRLRAPFGAPKLQLVPEDGIPEQSAGGVESFDLVGGHQPPS